LAVEVWGRGTNRVIAECRAHGIAPPSFEEREGWVVVTFRATIAPAGAGEAGWEKNEERSREKGKEKSTEKVIGLIAANPRVTTQKMAEALAMSRAGIEKVVRRLKEEGRLKRVGPDKGGRWEVTR
jgi:ATP-dependent DNA helicase RecG